MTLTYGDLPGGSALNAPSMFCSEFGEAHGVYSAYNGDYFWASTYEPVTCSECGAPMVLCEHVEYFRVVAR